MAVPKPAAPAAPKPPLKRKVVVLEEGTLTSLALNPAVVAEFPALASIAKLAKQPTRGGCGTCGRAAQERAQTYQKVKLAVAGLPSDRKRRLKDLLNANSVRLLYRDGKGKAQQLVF